MKINGSTINPGSLANFSSTNKKYSTYYIYKPRAKFTCDLLSCESSLDNYLTSFENDRGKLVTIKSTDEIVLTKNGGELLNCHDTTPSILDKEPLDEL